ncbi:MAG: 2'-5' RNA ligase family protein [Planctomycetaceae bacterium]|nr:2'-5' RNA ligase family protein [Planctomycetota bacterium]NUN52778.1 2'-5' RNA ligase family protein [Planctomycetaceae bacterium]
MEPRVAVVVPLPAEAAGPIEEFRRIHDPLFHKIAAHLVLVPAQGWCPEDRAVPRLLEAVRASGQGPFPVGLNGVGRTRDGVVFLRVEEGAEILAEMNRLLLAALGPPPGTEFPEYRPVVALGRGPGEAEAEFLQRQVAGHLAPVRFPAEAFSVVVEDARGLWHLRERLPLEPPPPPAERGPVVSSER